MCTHIIATKSGSRFKPEVVKVKVRVNKCPIFIVLRTRSRVLEGIRRIQTLSYHMSIGFVSLNSLFRSVIFCVFDLLLCNVHIKSTYQQNERTYT